MNKKLLLLSTVFFLVLSACNKERITGSGAIITKQREVNNFAKISISGSSNLYVTQGPDYHVEIKGYENLIPYFESNLVNNTLELGYRSDVNIKNDNIEVYVTLPALNRLSLSGSGNISTTGSFSGNTSFEMHISGSGNINFSEGSTQNYYTSISGSGSIYAFGMTAENAEISISGSGDNEITSTSTLKVSISGSGNVYYKGNPVISTQISGSGAVIPK